jgi:hypothetical protein
LEGKGLEVFVALSLNTGSIGLVIGRYSIETTIEVGRTLEDLPDSANLFVSTQSNPAPALAYILQLFGSKELCTSVSFFSILHSIPNTKSTLELNS